MPENVQKSPIVPPPAIVPNLGLASRCSPQSPSAIVAPLIRAVPCDAAVSLPGENAWRPARLRRPTLREQPGIGIVDQRIRIIGAN